MKVEFYEGYRKAPSKKRSPVSKKRRGGGGSPSQTSKFAKAVEYCKDPGNRKKGTKTEKFSGCMSSEMKKK